MARPRTKSAQNEGKTPKKTKAWNITPSPRLRQFVEAFVRMNERNSATAVVEEALREYFEKRGIKTDVDPADLLRDLLSGDKKD